MYEHYKLWIWCWQDDPLLVVKAICTSWENQISVAPKDVDRPSIFSIPNSHSLALVVNRSPTLTGYDWFWEPFRLLKYKVRSPSRISRSPIKKDWYPYYLFGYSQRVAKKPHFSPIPLLSTGFWLISIKMASFARKKAYFFTNLM